jgi:hypothetical protein
VVCVASLQNQESPKFYPEPSAPCKPQNFSLYRTDSASSHHPPPTTQSNRQPRGGELYAALAGSASTLSDGEGHLIPTASVPPQSTAAPKLVVNSRRPKRVSQVQDERFSSTMRGPIRLPFAKLCASRSIHRTASARSSVAQTKETHSKRRSALAALVRASRHHRIVRAATSARELNSKEPQSRHRPAASRRRTPSIASIMIGAYAPSPPSIVIVPM